MRSESAIPAHGLLGLADHDVRGVDAVQPEGHQEELLDDLLLFVGERLLVAPVHHPAVGVEQAAVQEDDVVGVLVGLVREDGPRVDAGPHVVYRRGAGDVLDDLCALLGTEHPEPEPPQVLVELGDGRRLAGRRGTGQLHEERTRQMTVVIPQVALQVCQDALGFLVV
jgi:hypothetical protein